MWIGSIEKLRGSYAQVPAMRPILLDCVKLMRGWLADMSIELSKFENELNENAGPSESARGDN
jgi:hypothetical protein